MCFQTRKHESNIFSADFNKIVVPSFVDVVTGWFFACEAYLQVHFVQLQRVVDASSRMTSCSRDTAEVQSGYLKKDNLHISKVVFL